MYMKHNKMWRRALSCLALSPAMILAGCGEDATEPDGQATGFLVVHLTDAPFPFDMVDSTTVRLDSVTVHRVSQDGGSGFMTIDRTPRTIDLLDLQNGVTDTLASVELPIGTIDQIRLHVGEATVYLTDDRQFVLDIPSGHASGIKVFPVPPIQVVTDVTSELLLDFDVSQSFRAIPSAPGHVSEIQSFAFDPVLRVGNLSTAGSISGSVFDDAGTPDDPLDDQPLENAAVTVFDSGIEVTSTSTNALGDYTIMGLIAGAYTVVASATGFEPDSPPVTVVAGNEIAGVDFRLTALP